MTSWTTVSHFSALSTPAIIVIEAHEICFYQSEMASFFYLFIKTYVLGIHWKSPIETFHMGSKRKNLSSGFLTKRDSNQSLKLHRLARKLEFCLKQV